MVDVVLQGVWVLYRINKDEGNKSLPPLVFRFEEIMSILFFSKIQGKADYPRAT